MSASVSTAVALVPTVKVTVVPPTCLQEGDRVTVVGCGHVLVEVDRDRVTRRRGYQQTAVDCRCA